MNALNDMHDAYQAHEERQAILDDIQRCHDQHTPACNLVSVITYRGGYREIILEFVQSITGKYYFLVLRDNQMRHVPIKARAIQSVDDTYIPGGVALLQAYTLWKSLNHQYQKLAGFRDTVARFTYDEDGNDSYSFDDEWVDACHTAAAVKRACGNAWRIMLALHEQINGSIK